MSPERRTPTILELARALGSRVLAWARERAKVVAPRAAVALGLFFMLVLAFSGPEADREDRTLALPLVRVMRAEPETFRLTVKTFGTVAPRIESELVPEVSGALVWISPSLVSGGFFEKGEVLLRVDRSDYEVSLARAAANLARQESEHRRATKDLTRQRRLAVQNVASAAQLDDAINAEKVAAASLAEARASLSQAERDLERTEILAPYAGRVREESVDVGQFVSRGQPTARLYSIDVAEVRLPVADDELAFLDLPLLHWGEDNGGRPEVLLRARFAGAEHTWQGWVERTEGEIDAQSRRVNVIARVENPYAVESERPPLAVGLFVEAEIFGQLAEDAVVLPRVALRGPGRVYVIDEDDRLRFRDVVVLRTAGEQTILRSGLVAGERVCVSPIETAVDGMRVRVVGEPAPEADL